MKAFRDFAGMVIFTVSVLKLIAVAETTGLYVPLQSLSRQMRSDKG
jgi:hypothetical protein